MKKLFLTTLFVLIGLLLTSCKKNREEQPYPANEKTKFNISIESLPGQNNAIDGLSAVITIKSATGHLVIENQAIPLNHRGNYVSDPIELPKGNYELVKLLLQHQGNTLFATPCAGSIMAQQVNKPLAISINLQKTEHTVAIEVLAVTINHKAEDFGYTGEVFNHPPPIDNADDFVLNLKPIFKVGKIVYDSIPAVLNITTYPLQGNPTTQTYYIAAGGQKLTLAKKVAKYKLSIAKWGMIDEVELEQADMTSEVKLFMGGSTEVAKKIKTESVYLFSGGRWIPQTRKEYSYNALGQVTRITHLSKATDGSPVTDGTEELIYQANNKVSEIRYQVNGTNKVNYFWYKPDGKLERMKEINEEDTITAEVSYLAQPGKTGITNNYQIGATYQYSRRYYKQYATAEMQGGNAYIYTNHTSHGDSETTTATYDFNINPYAHLDIPDFWLTQLSKHNRLNKWSRYETYIPKYNAYQFSYTYDVEGFPKEIITKYNISNTATDAYITKTVFTY
ncbi:hypothetical protein [Pedobacter sp. UBA4863]|uniref:hypothetical protein n=1 Tax=Pedobacter sp. UBA4863 TaxID=1947060 RepID=UPI0025FCB01B|nr:hypothetical protein [Pedobacter sp. UBA4863]